MIENAIEERLILLEALGTNFRLYFRCERCGGVFLHGSGHPQTDAPIVCPSCFNSAPGTAYSRAIGMVEEVGWPEPEEATEAES